MEKKYNISISAGVMSAIADHTNAISYFDRRQPEFMDIKWDYKGDTIESRIFLSNVIALKSQEEIISYVQNFIEQANRTHDEALNSIKKAKRFKIDIVDIVVALIAAALILVAIFALK